MESLAPLIPQGRLYKRALQRAFLGEGGRRLTSLGMPLFLSVHGFFKQWLTGWTYPGSPCLPLKRNSSRIHPTGVGVYTWAPCQHQASGPKFSVLLSYQPAQTGGNLPGASTVSYLTPRTTCSSEYSSLPYKQAGWGEGEGPPLSPRGRSTSFFGAVSTPLRQPSIFQAS